MHEVAFAIPNLTGGGAERVFVTLLRHLDRSRVRPTLLLGRARGDYLRDVPHDVVVHELGSERARHAVPSLVRAVRALEPAVLMTTLGFAPAGAFARPFLPRRTALVSRLGNTLSAYLSDVRSRSRFAAAAYRHMNQLVCTVSDAVICQSDHMIADTRREIGSRGNLVRIHNPVDLGALRLRAERQDEQIDWGDAWPRIISLGRLHPSKGYDVLIEAMRSVVASYPSARLKVFGKGPEHAALERQCRAAGLEGRVQLPGFTDLSSAWVASADLYVCASRFEGLSNAMLEALALGVPVVATDCPSAVREVLTPSGAGGVLVSTDDAAQLAHGLLRAVDELESLRAGVPQLRIEERFGADGICDQYVALFDRVTRR